MKKIAVIGSFNRDMIIQISHIPARGETVGNGRFSEAFGGKGANQALACARAGGSIIFVSSVGLDSVGNQAIQQFVAEGIETRFMRQTDIENTGTAFIFVGDDGENSIAVAPGANEYLQEPLIDEASGELATTAFILMQLEIPFSTVEYVLDKAQHWQVPVILNPAPARSLSDAVLAKVHTLILNETEAEIISGEKLSEKKALQTITRQLIGKGPQIVIITLGSQGAYVASENFNGLIPGYKVETVDTTAAGDVFCGAFTTAICHDQPLVDAVKFANAAGAIATTKLGAQSSVPYKKEIEALWKKK